jgi:hypothetical protein
MRRVLLLLALLAGPLAALDEHNVPPREIALDRAFDRMYNFDFPGVYAILDRLDLQDPSYPVGPAVRAAAMLFNELDRMQILQTEFFTDDDRVTDRKLIKPDPKLGAALFRATGEARRRGAERLAANPADRDAMFAMCMATGVETDYTILVEKRYFRSFALSRESQSYAHKLLALDPPVVDAYLTLGSVEYTVGSMNFFFRLFVRFDQIKGSKQQGIENLKKVIQAGRYYPPFAKLLLSVIYLREKQPQLALPLLQDLSQSFPENPLLRNEVARATKLVERAGAKKR